MYYYFEHNSKPGDHTYSSSYELRIEQFEHCNELKFMPHTSSTGEWGSSHYHSKQNNETFTYDVYKIVQQYWIDTNKYVNGCDNICDYFIKHIVPLLNNVYCESI